MLSPWLNMQVRVQRRPANPARNSLNEPAYGNESSYPVVYDMMWARIEYVEEQMVFTDTGERVKLSGQTALYVEADFLLKPMDRITIQTSDNPALIGQLYLIQTVYSEWNSMGNVHHYVCDIQVH